MPLWIKDDELLKNIYSNQIQKKVKNAIDK